MGRTEARLPELIQVLGEPTRRRVVETLSRGPRRAGDLADELGVTAPSMSKHLRVLLRAGIVADARTGDDARARLFLLREEPLAAMRAWLDQLQAHWDEQLGSFKAHVEQRAGAEKPRTEGKEGR